MLSSIRVVDKAAAEEAYRQEQKSLKKEKKKHKKVATYSRDAPPFHWLRCPAPARHRPISGVAE